MLFPAFSPSFRLITVVCMLVACVLVSGCGGPRVEPLSQEALLSLTPDDAATGIVFPSIDAGYEDIIAFLDRAAPETVDMNVEAQLVAEQIAGMLGSSSQTPSEIALDKGVDSALPAAIYIRGAKTKRAQAVEEVAPEEPAAPGSNETGAQPTQKTVSPSSYFKKGIQSLSNGIDFAAVFHVYDTVLLNRTLATWGKTTSFTPQPELAPGYTVFASADGQTAYAATPRAFVVGNALDMVSAVTAQLLKVAGSPQSNADLAAETKTLQILNADLFSSSSSTKSETTGTTPQLSSLGPLFSGLGKQRIEWTAKDTGLEAVSHSIGAYAADVTTSPLLYAPLFPSDTIGVIGVHLNDDVRKKLIDSSVGGSNAPKALVDQLGDEIAIGISKPVSGRAGYTFAMHLNDSGAVKNQIGNIGLSMLAFESYNGVDVYPVILPELKDYDLHAAIPGDTLVASTDTNKLKTMIDHVQSGKATPLFSALKPPLDPKAPRSRVMVFSGEFFRDVAWPYLTQNAELAQSKDRAPWFSQMFDRVREVRLISAPANGKEETHLSIDLN